MPTSPLFVDSVTPLNAVTLNKLLPLDAVAIASARTLASYLAAADTHLYRRSGSNLQTDGTFWAGNSLVVDGSSGAVGANKLYIGGGLDTNIFRQSAGNLRTDGGLFFGADTRIYRYAANLISFGDGTTPTGIQIAPATASTLAIQLLPGFNGPNQCWSVRGDGYMAWGLGGANAIDTNFGRISAGMLLAIGQANGNLGVAIGNDANYGGVFFQKSGVRHAGIRWDGSNLDFLDASGGIAPSNWGGSVILRVDLVNNRVVVGGALATTGSGSYGTSFPASPVDGQEYTLVDSTTNPTYQWHFRYNAASTSAYKWEFIGGAPAVAFVSTVEGTVSTAYTALATPGPSITLARAGDYQITVQSQMSMYQVLQLHSYDVGATAALDGDAAQCYNPGSPSGSTNCPFTATRLKTGILAGSAIV